MEETSGEDISFQNKLEQRHPEKKLFTWQVDASGL